MVGTSDLGMSAFCHMSNSCGVVELCTTIFNEVGTSDLGTHAFFHIFKLT